MCSARESGTVASNGASKPYSPRARAVARFGFTPGEIAREKAELLRSMETAYKERDKTESARFAEECADNFLSSEPMPGVEFEYRCFGIISPVFRG